VPGVIGALFFSGLGLTEAAFLKRIGADALAAVAMVFPLVMLSAMFSAGAIGGAVSGRTARAIGAGDSDEASSVLVCAVLIAVVGGLLMCFFVLLLGSSLFEAATKNRTVSNAAFVYAITVFPFMPVFWLTNMLCSVLRGSGDMIRPAQVAASMLIAYMVFAWFLIPHDSIDLQVDMVHAAMSMNGAFLVALSLTLFFMLHKNQPIRFRLSSFKKRTMTGILKQGLLASSQSIMTITYALVTTLLFSRYGTQWLAGFGLAVRLELVMVPIIFGIGATLIAIVGAYVGAGQRQRAIAIAWRGILINAGLVGLIGLLIFLVPGIWCRLVGSDQTVISHCEQSLRVIAPTYVFFALGLGGYFASQGLNTLKFPVLGAMLRLIIVSSGLFWVVEETPILVTLMLVAVAVTIYGLFVVVTLKCFSWRSEKYDAV